MTGVLVLFLSLYFVSFGCLTRQFCKGRRDKEPNGSARTMCAGLYGSVAIFHDQEQDHFGFGLLLFELTRGDRNRYIYADE